MAGRKTPSSPPVMPDDLRRQDPRPDRPDSLPEIAEDIAHAGISPSPDGDNPLHPIHDEDIEDAGPEDYEEMIDREGMLPVDKVIPK